MTDPSISRNNFDYANKLKRQGFPTAVHALPAEALEYVDEQLRKDVPLIVISNEVNRRYATELKQYELKPISATSLKSYKENYFYQKQAIDKPVMAVIPALQNRMQLAMEAFNSYGKMLELAKTQIVKASMMDEKENQLQMPIKRADESRELAFNMLSKIFQFEMDSGARGKAPMEITERSLNLTMNVSQDEKNMTTKELIDRAMYAVSVLKDKDDGNTEPTTRGDS